MGGLGGAARRKGGPARAYAWFCGVFLFFQGTSTLAARLFPPVDRMFPALLQTTRMVAPHSVLHVATALLAVAALARGARATWWFAVVFGCSYAGLGLLGLVAHGRTLGLGLQPFDHPFHILLGGLGIVAAWRTPREPADRP